MSSKKQRVGFIGVGLMGHGMAKNIVEKGYPLSIMGHRNRKPVTDLVRRGAKEAKSPADMAKNSDVIFLCVTSSVQVEDLIRRKDGIKAGAHKGLIIVDCSTADPTSTIELAEELKPLGVRLIDAPLGRSPKEAEEGLLNTFIGADAKTLKEVRPIIETWAENIIHVGPLGAGHKMKLVNNFVAMSYVAIYAEAFTTAQKTGVPLEKFHEVISAGGLNSGMFQNVCKWVIGGDPKAHEFTLANCDKDIRYYNQLADSEKLTTVVASAVKQSYAMALAMGRGADNMPMLADAVANFNGVTIQPESRRTGKKPAKAKAKKGKKKK
ncbi:NAD(P)-dependent oxidoreductase [Pelagibius marinus]|uniref:NAD(P)-dependent oxidoreductase n=1 Tax=Pelagibius marinus TaxID=2762760 RepID=UPI0029CA5067|nr:NAD(P)-dependent oxidoreductase [Pelagibius marinus]